MSESSSNTSDSDSSHSILKKELPSRSTRGLRIEKLLTEEEAAADEEFWGQEAWQVDDDVAYSTESEEQDSVDSDFDEEEHPDEDIHDRDGVDANRRRKSAKRSVYKEPVRVKKPVKSTTRKVPVKMEHVPIQRTLRQSTVQKTTEFTKRYQQRAREMKQAESKEVKRAPIKRLTQQELLAEAIRTEVYNNRSLNRLEQLEEEKKIRHATNTIPSTGGVLRYHSQKATGKTITLLNIEDDQISSTLFYQHPKKTAR